MEIQATKLQWLRESFEEASFSHWLERETYPNTGNLQYDVKVVDSVYSSKSVQILVILHAKSQRQYLRGTFLYCWCCFLLRLQRNSGEEAVVHIHFPGMWAANPHPQRPPAAAAPNGSFAKAAWQPQLFMSLPLVGSLPKDKTASSRKSPCQPKEHTHVSLLQWKAEEFFSINSACTISKQQALAAGVPMLTWMALEMSRGKAKSARVHCRFIPALICSPEFHNNLSNSD